MRTALLPFLILMAVACGNGPVDPDQNPIDELDDRPNSSGTSNGIIVRLLEPSNNQILAQNDSTIGCPAHANRGFGFQIKFAWTVSSTAEVAGYNVFVKHRTSQFPWLDILVDTDHHTETSCNGFVADHNLDNWEWKVRALENNGSWGPWSAASVFHFEACRHADGRRCVAPGE